MQVSLNNISIQLKEFRSTIGCLGGRVVEVISKKCPLLKKIGSNVGCLSNKVVEVISKKCPLLKDFGSTVTSLGNKVVEVISKQHPILKATAAILITVLGLGILSHIHSLYRENRKLYLENKKNEQLEKSEPDLTLAYVILNSILEEANAKHEILNKIENPNKNVIDALKRFREIELNITVIKTLDVESARTAEDVLNFVKYLNETIKIQRNSLNKAKLKVDQELFDNT